MELTGTSSTNCHRITTSLLTHLYIPGYRLDRSEDQIIVTGNSRSRSPLEFLCQQYRGLFEDPFDI